MMYKATLAFSLLFLAVVGSAQNDTSAQPPSSTTSSTTTSTSPSGIPSISATPTTSDGDSSQTKGTRPSGCYPHNEPHSAIPTDQLLSSGVFSSSAHGASPVSDPHFRCEPNSESTIPTGKASDSAYGTGALPSTYDSRPIQSMAPTGSHHDGNFTLPTGSSKPFPSGPGQEDPPAATATTSYVGRRMLVRRQF